MQTILIIDDDEATLEAMSDVLSSQGYDIVSKSSGKPAYTQIFGDWLCDMAARDSRLIGITPAMREGSGLVRFSQEYPERYFDVGIAEQDRLGGTCLNRGCIPTKALLAGVALKRELERASEFGLSTGELKLDYAVLAARKDRVVKRLVQGIQFLFKKNESGSGKQYRHPRIPHQKYAPCPSGWLCLNRPNRGRPSPQKTRHD